MMVRHFFLLVFNRLDEEKVLNMHMQNVFKFRKAFDYVYYNYVKSVNIILHKLLVIKQSLMNAVQIVLAYLKINSDSKRFNYTHACIVITMP